MCPREWNWESAVDTASHPLHNSQYYTPNPYDSSSSKRTEDDNSPVPAPEQGLPPSPHQPVETENSIPQSQEGVSPTSGLKLVMDTFGPVAEVRVIPFSCP